MLEVEVVSVSSRRRGRLKILTARVADGSGKIEATWFNQPWLEARLKPGTQIRLRGRQNRYGFAVSSYDLEGETETADFAPVYPASEDISQKKLRELRAQVLDRTRDTGEPLPAELRVRESLPLRADALAAVHRPATLAAAELGRVRLAFDELLVLRLALARTAAARERQSAEPLAAPGSLIASYRAALPFELTTRPGARDSGDRRRSRPHDADAPAAPRGRRRREDRRRALRPPARGRGRETSRADGADRDTRRTALPDRRGALPRARAARRAPHQLSAREPPRERARSSSPPGTRSWSSARTH